MKFEYILFVVYLIIAIAGQLLQKLGINEVGAIGSATALFSKGTVGRILASPMIWFGAVLSVTAFALWIIVLSNFKMNYIYAFSSVAYVVMALVSILVLKETIAWNQWVGICVIVGGCFLLNVKL